MIYLVLDVVIKFNFYSIIVSYFLCTNFTFMVFIHKVSISIRKNFDIVRNLCFAPRNFIDDSGKVEGRRRARKNVHYCVRGGAQ